MRAPRVPIRLLQSSLRPLNSVTQRGYMSALVRVLRRRGVVLDGAPRWIGPSTFFDIPEPGLISLGHDCVISENVVLLTHDYSMGTVAVGLGHGSFGTEMETRARIAIGRSAFLGFGCMILPGVSVGDYAVVGAGSVVTRDVPPREIWAGNPATFRSSIGDFWDRKASNYETRAPRR